jgi:hypothetical protein
MKGKVPRHNDFDPVERSRQARRDLERQFATSEEFFEWLQRLDEERLAREARAAKRQAPRPRSTSRSSSKRSASRRSAKSRGQS